MIKTDKQSGAVSPLLIATIVLAVLAAALGGFATWAFINYQDQKNNVDGIVAEAVTEAEVVQAEELEAEFIEREKEPNWTFTGPTDLGSVSFKYPKTWSVYVAESATSSYEAYLHPNVVPPVSDEQAFATRVIIEDDTYAEVVSNYDRLVKNGDLRSRPVEINGFEAIRIEGKFKNDINGTAVILKVRDKALTLFTDADTFKKDFDSTILKTLTYNP